MNDIDFKLNILRDQDTFEYENIIYSKCAFIKLIVDGVDLIKETEDRKGIIVWDELKKTRDNSGDFLILTCVCGIADDAGFKLVTVDRGEKEIKWTFNDDTDIVWKFDKADYDLKLLNLNSQIEKLTVNLEPTNVIFPQSAGQ
jgi:hypothetical protein